MPETPRPANPQAASRPPAGTAQGNYAPPLTAPLPRPGSQPLPVPPPRPTRRKGGAVATALVGLTLLVVAGLIAMDRYTGWLSGWLMPALGFGVAMVLMGFGLIVLGLMGRKAGGFVAASIVLAFLAIPSVALATASSHSFGRMSAGEFHYQPETVAEAERSFGVTMGQVEVDLTKVPLNSERTVKVDVGVGMGLAVVIVPSDRPVVVNAQIAAGAIVTTALSQDWVIDNVDSPRDPSWEKNGPAGISVQTTIKSPQAVDHKPQLQVELSGSMGQLNVKEG
jgi:hypothetical protein